jgi:hypothetical protein
MGCLKRGEVDIACAVNGSSEEWSARVTSSPPPATHWLVSPIWDDSPGHDACASRPTTRSTVRRSTRR